MAKKQFSNKTLVIVCEGTETEYPYFSFFKEKLGYQYDDFRIIESRENLDKINKLRSKENAKSINEARKRGLAPEQVKKPPYYLTLKESEDDVDANYKKYAQAPAKYVREAYLQMKQNGFAEAWVVYDLDDKDDKGHKNHNEAKDLIDKTGALNKAFSSYCFEEWLLLHYERCITPYRHSECFDSKELKQYDKDKKGCGHAQCKHPNDCHGENCLGGRLRAKGHLPEYGKNKGSEYAEMIMNDPVLRHKAYVNASWSRSLKDAIYYECNPYSDVDQLIMRLLDEHYDIKWMKVDEKFTLDGHNFTITAADGSIQICHDGDENYVFSKDNVYWCDEDYKFITSAVEGCNINFSPENNQPKMLVGKPDTVPVLCIKSGKQEFYFDLQKLWH